MSNSFKLIFFFIFLFTSCNRNNQIFDTLTNDSSSMWDMKIVEKRKVGEHDSISINRHVSYLFHKNFVCEVFNVGPTDRIALKIGPKINVTGLCNKWEIVNDSIIKLNCKKLFIVKIIDKDTLYLFDTLGVKKHELYRVKKPWNINKESVNVRDKLIENNEYLSPYIYY